MRSQLPIFPLNTVLFPAGLLPLRIFETRYMDMVRECLKTKKPFGVCLIKDGREVGKPAVPESVGTLAHIGTCDMQQLGLLNIATRGGQRFRIDERSALSHNSQGLILADVMLLPDEEDATVPNEFAACAKLIEMVIRDKGAGVFSEPTRLNSASWIGHRLSEILPIPNSAKQKLLELDDSVTRLEVLQRFLEQRGLARG